MRPHTIRIFLPDGDSDGIRVSQIMMSTIQAIAFRRNRLSEVRGRFPEVRQPGVYILIGEDEENPVRQLAYIGESEDVYDRLRNQNRDKTKGFWTETVVLISIDGNLTKGHARFVEAELIRGVGSNPRWALPNDNQPSGDTGRLPLPDKVAMEEFVIQAKALIGALGWDIFRQDLRVRNEANQTGQALVPGSHFKDLKFSFEGREFDAEMELGSSGEIVVLADSRARAEEVPTIPQSASALRKILQESGILRKEDDYLVFTEDYSFSSVSAAAATVAGRSENGRIKWKLPDGRTYADWEENQEDFRLS